MNKNQSTEDLQTVVNALLGQLKQQNRPTKTPTKSTWIDRNFAAPKSLEAVIWRGCWLIVVPALLTRLWLPIADWCWVNGYPLVTLVVTGGVLLFWYLLYLFTLNSEGAKNMQKLVELQFTIPTAVAFFVFAWETLNHGG
jgi:hypothetical protein